MRTIEEMEQYETETTYNNSPSRFLSATMLKKEIKVFQPKELSRKRDPKKWQAEIIKAEKNMTYKNELLWM